ncbi:MAG TPA: hypothetical protein VMD02_05360 [Candidatus Omnitrophota bacterium]|nr:hypothetical protein [Candidatus Omnitrophota bacterium]
MKTRYLILPLIVLFISGWVCAGACSARICCCCCGDEAPCYTTAPFDGAFAADAALTDVVPPNTATHDIVPLDRKLSFKPSAADIPPVYISQAKETYPSNGPPAA